MKKILITGAAGSVGRKTIKYLLSEGKYEITAIDIKTSKNKRYLNKYKRRINIIYGDITDDKLMEALIKDMNFVIHLASSDMNLANYNPNLAYEIDYKGTETIVRMIDFYNPDCHLLYASSVSIYGKQDKDTVSVSTTPNLTQSDVYSSMKLDSENIIKKKLKNYSIYRLPVILCNPITDNFIFTFDKNAKIETVAENDVAYMFSRAIDKIELVNKKTFNVGGGEHCKTTALELTNEILKYFGLTKEYLKSRLLLDRNFYSYYFKDSDKLDELLSYRNDSIKSYFMRVKRRKVRYKVRKLFAKPFIKKEKLDKNK